jgi:hypothetical protein
VIDEDLVSVTAVVAVAVLGVVGSADATTCVFAAAGLGGYRMRRGGSQRGSP